MAFLLPTECGERISLVITLNLGVGVLSLMVADIMPATAEGIALIGVFFTEIIVLLSLNSVVTGNNCL